MLAVTLSALVLSTTVRSSTLPFSMQEAQAKKAQTLQFRSIDTSLSAASQNELAQVIQTEMRKLKSSIDVKLQAPISNKEISVAIKIGELKVGNHTKKNVTFKVQNITSAMLKNKYYKIANNNHQTYKNYSKKQLMKISDVKKEALINSCFFYYDSEVFPNTLENRAYSNALWGFSYYYYEKLDRKYMIGISFAN